MSQSSVLPARAFSQKTMSLLVEQALLSLEAKLVQAASPCFQCNHLPVPKICQSGCYLTLTADKDYIY